VLIVFDVGNSETTIGLFEHARSRDGNGEAERPPLLAHWRITTDLPRTADEYGILLRGLLGGAPGHPSQVKHASIGSVVPRVTEPLVSACERWLGAERVTVVDAGSPLPIRLDVEEPLSVGADRIINTLAASRLFGRDAIVVDLGTATTYDCITADGVFLGGIIAPGVRSSAETLFRRTSKLPATELVMPREVIGRRTEECIRAGVIFGAAEGIDGTVRRIREAWPTGETPIVIATGGLAETFASVCRSFDRVDPHLTLEGLRLAHGILAGA
jgi:type III pantothenate kinase